MAFPQCGYTPIKLGSLAVEEAVKQLTPLISTRPNWPFTLGCSLMQMPAMYHSLRRGAPECLGGRKH